MHLRFQLPPAVLPLQVERARLIVKVSAPSRRVTLSVPVDGGPVELYRAESPLDPIRLDITERRLLRPDEDGGLHLHLSISDLLLTAGEAQPAPDRRGDRLLPDEERRPSTERSEKWTIEYLELEVSGQAEG
jgi:hypothetical protein